MTLHETPETAQQSEPVTTGTYIGGSAREATDHLEIRDPADPSVVVGKAAAATTADAEEAVAAARTAYPAWSALTPQQRAEQILAAISGLEEHRDADAEVLAKENGKILPEAAVDLMVFNIRTELAAALADEVDASHELPGPPVTTTVSYQPLGVVTIIVPFNWPVAILGAALPHALMAGNTVIVKPPPTCPLATTRVVQRVAEKLPPGVLNVITGRDADLSPLIASPDVAKVCFTGSVGGGAKIMELASKSLTRVTLELGGNDPAIILDDAVLDEDAFDRLFAGIFDSTGQICMNAKRIYVQRQRYDEVVQGLAARLEKTVLGHALEDGTTMGPLHAASQKQFVQDLVSEARDSGAEVREFGELPARYPDGNFLRPSLVLDPSPDLRVVTEEQFGPTVPIIPFETEEEAVAAANNTWGGLCASVWTGDPARADRVGGQLVCGFVFVNDHGATRLDLRAPFGGMKGSGMGREQGIEGIRDFQDTRSIGHLQL
ncbi:aldehyde dehydrogenase family protein [Georgenia halophila]|uniref:Aldehyde dehydrogenase family protein n=1 Tax=Georgenia halophila TaxID=620889 RepID=A0ABP8KS49_9MICO